MNRTPKIQIATVTGTTAAIEATTNATTKTTTAAVAFVRGTAATAAATAAAIVLAAAATRVGRAGQTDLTGMMETRQRTRMMRAAGRAECGGEGVALGTVLGLRQAGEVDECGV